MPEISKSYDDLVEENKQLKEQLSTLSTDNVNNFETFFDKLDDLLFVLSDEGIILEVNETALNYLHYKKEELVD